MIATTMQHQPTSDERLGSSSGSVSSTTATSYMQEDIPKRSKGLLSSLSSSSSSLSRTPPSSSTKRTNNNRYPSIQIHRQQPYNDIFSSLMLSNVWSLFTIQQSSSSFSSSSPRSVSTDFRCGSSCSSSCCNTNNMASIKKGTPTTPTTASTMIVIKPPCLLKIALVVLCLIVVLQLRGSQSILDLSTSTNNTPTPMTQVTDDGTSIRATTNNFLRQRNVSTKQVNQQQQSLSVLSIIHQFFNYPFIYRPRNMYAYQQHIIGQYNHTIPNVLTFTYKYNLINTTLPYTTDTPNLSKEQREELALQKNVYDIIATHPESKVRFLTDDDCVKSLTVIMNQLYNNNATITETMVQYFRNEKRGMYRGDICRGVALYETGGLYFDVDLGVRYSVWNIIRPDTEFVTINALKIVKENRNGFFQAFIGVTPHHPLIGRYIDLFYQYYQGQLPDVSETTLLGVAFLRRAYDDIIRQQHEHKDMEREQLLKTNTTMDLLRSTNLEQHTQLWDEVYYDPKTMGHVPLPNWGDKGLCDVVAVANVTRTMISRSLLSSQEQHQQHDNHSTPSDQKGKEKEEEYILDVPIYSRIADSRYCFSSTPYDEWKRKYTRIFNRHIRIRRWSSLATNYFVGTSSKETSTATKLQQQ